MAIVLLAGLSFRLWGLHLMPFQHDEFSAIFRLGYPSLGELIREGVALRDSHPPGVQIFLYYWTRIAGFDHFWLRLPFVLLGTASIWLLYRAGQRLFGSVAGLQAAAAMACMQFFVYYSQMARPYIPGVFLSLLAFNLLIDIIKADSGRFGPKHLWLSFAFALSAWMHHFSAFQAGLIFVSGFMLSGRHQYKSLIFTGLLALLWYLPCLNVTLTQLRAGGIGDWLGKPGPAFLAGFFSYVVNYSVIFGAVLLLPRFFGSAAEAEVSKVWQTRSVLALLFFIPLLLGFAYSVWRVPVLQFSTLIFGFPFLMLAIFSFGRGLSFSVHLIVVIIILAAGTGSLLFGRKHVQLMQQQAFALAPARAVEDASRLGGDFTFAAVSSTPAMFAFYMPENKVSGYRLFNKREPLGNFSSWLDTLPTEYLGFAWADYVPYEWIAAARSVYGEVVTHQVYFNAEYYLLRRSRQPFAPAPGERLLRDDRFEPPFVVDGSEYGLLFESDSLFDPQDDVVAVSLRCQASDTLSQARLVLEFRVHPDSLPVVWLAGETGRKILPGAGFTLNAAWRFDSGPASLRNARLRTYVWNPAGEHFEVSGRYIWTSTYDKRLFGLFKPI